MKNDRPIWRFIYEHLSSGLSVMLLVVAESSGSSPGRAGYKMAVSGNGELCGSIGGGVMEVDLVEQGRAAFSQIGSSASGGSLSQVKKQVHRANVPNSSGMICSGSQTVIFRLLGSSDLPTVNQILNAKESSCLLLTSTSFELSQAAGPLSFELLPDDDFRYSEPLEIRDRLIIIGGGHCALALSEAMARLNFHISIIDDRPELNTIEKNRFADRVSIIETYKNVGELVPDEEDLYVVVMTLGYVSDMEVIRRLVEREFRYLGVLGSRAKVATMFRELKNEGLDGARLARIHSPVGLPINSRTPEEIAISIAAEIIAVKNGAPLADS